jgi:predicted nucleic acid-binding protein
MTLAWHFDDEATAATDAVLDQVAEAGAVVPTVWRLEVANGMQMAVRRNRIDSGYRDAVLAELGRMPIVVDHETDAYAWTTTLRIADRFGLTIYDAAYLELADRRAVPLATLDQPLRAAAINLGLQVLGRADK